MADYKYNPLLRFNLQEEQDIPEPPTVTVDDELSTSSINPVQNKVITNKINDITSDSIDIDVTTLAEFVAAVQRSGEVSVRIHLRGDISLTEDLTVNLDNCQIYGHDNRIFLENHAFIIEGEYCYFYQVRFNASSLVTANTANQSDYENACIKLISTAPSTRFFFEFVVFMNFICHSFDKQVSIIKVNSTSSGSPSLHTYFLYCEVMTNYLGTNLPRINDCVWSIENIGSVLHCLTANIIDYWSTGYDGTNYDSTKNFNFSGNALQGFAKLAFTSDASINYAASPSGYTSLTPNAVNIYNPSRSEFQALYDYVHGNNFATAAQGEKADSALQSISKGTDGSYITTTVTAKDANNQQKVSVLLKIQDINTTDTDHRGLLEAFNTRNYIDTQIYNVSLNFFFYGVQWDENNPSPGCTRIGNMSLHAELPIQNSIIGGLLQDDLTFTPFTDQSDWSGETVDGSAGQVMVRIPRHYVKFETHGTINKVLMSEYPLVGFTEVPMFYISAFKAALDRTDPNTPKLCSVVNTAPEFRGGDNTADWDGTYRSLLGKPTSNISLTNFRQYARNRGNGTVWNCHIYLAQRVLYWLFVSEYATLNSQKAFNAAKDANGYAQGGLGPGVSNWDNAWNAYNGYNPLIPCGYMLEYGNQSAVKNYSIKDADDNILVTFEVNSYRGIQSPFGDIWDWTDGILINVQSDAEGGISTCYITDDPAKFSSTDFSQYTELGNTPRTDNWIKTIFDGEQGDIICNAQGGSSTSYYCDYYWGANLPESGISLRGVLFGGLASNGSLCGFLCASSNCGPGHVHPHIGSRLCAIPPP